MAVVGLNAYVSDGDWPKDDAELQWWYPGWWSEAGHGRSHRFFNTAYREAGLLADELAGRSKLFSGLTYDAGPQSKSGIYGTNAIKVFLGGKHKTSDGLSPADFQKYAPAWHQELDTMAEHGVLPHLVVALGQQIWELMWGSFYPDWSKRVQYQHFTVTDYQTCGTSMVPATTSPT